MPSAATIMSLSEPRAADDRSACTARLAVGLEPQESLGLHRHDQQTPVGQPTETGRFVVVDTHDRVGVAVERGGDDPVVVHVAAPKPTVVASGVLR